MFQKISTLLFCLSLFACAPKSIVSPGVLQYPPVAEFEPFAVFELDDKFDIQAVPVGEVRIKDSGLTIDCDYETVLNLAKEKARAMGANCLKIYEHKLPSPMSSTCHRIRAKAYRLDDVTPYEKEIAWHKARKLKRADFKGSTENRPFEAATQSGIQYRYGGRLYQGKVRFSVRTVFNCQGSYFKGTANVEETLAHEQLHFDITEIYARKLIRAVQTEIQTAADLEQKTGRIYQQIVNECATEQDKYDSEVYADRSKQSLWSLKVRQELESLNAYADKEVDIPFKR